MSIYNITQLLGKPQGPLFFSPVVGGVAAGARSDLLIRVGSVTPGVEAVAPPVVVPVVLLDGPVRVVATAAGSSVFAAAVSAPPSSQAKLTFDTAL